ncbi:UNVERIFIED_CONTAM: hypothetical protein Slati_0196900 [Sesamum latifolium]|uniref:Uncharacterized protein n=1 Tax=Sesamum latifolium TaxID=2727402 RepID=A0AAW2YB36_9LAMI
MACSQKHGKEWVRQLRVHIRARSQQVCVRELKRFIGARSQQVCMRKLRAAHWSSKLTCMYALAEGALLGLEANKYAYASICAPTEGNLLG